jgi:hypothetical protein
MMRMGRGEERTYRCIDDGNVVKLKITGADLPATAVRSFFIGTEDMRM